MFEYGDIQKLAELFNPKVQNSNSDEEDEDTPGPSGINSKGKKI